MNLNHFMHPRNPYRVKRHFALLAQEFPDFAPFVKHFDNGNATIDFKDPLALRSLTVTLLKKDFNLIVDLPPDRLIPAVPQRLNYVLWIEDLVSSLALSPDTRVTGIDVGVGASCIFPLLVCRNNPDWSMTGFDVDPESLAIAEKNVVTNGLENRISLVKVDEDEDWTHHVAKSTESFHFLMCNPPFFPHEPHHTMDNEFECNSSHRESEMDEPLDERRVKSPGNTSCVSEAVVSGGEVAFVQSMIDRSFQLKDKIRIFSVMLGRKSSLSILKRELRNFQSENSDLSLTSTELCQGKTMRWAIAWSFTSQLEKAVVDKVKKPGKPFILSPIPYKKGMYYSIEGFTDRILDLIVQDLQIRTFRLIRMSHFSSEIVLKSLTNTWSNQRKKRREKMRHQDKSPNTSTTEPDTQSCDNQMEGTNGQTSHKRKRDDDDGDEESGDHHEAKQLSPDECCKRIKERASKAEKMSKKDEGISYLLNCCIGLRKEGQGITLRVERREPCHGPESTYQMFQYLKNKLSQAPDKTTN